MQADHIPYTLELKHPFTISGFTRTSTPLLLLRLQLDGFTGYGEASMVPYLGESYNSAEAFLQQINWSRFRFPFDFSDMVSYLDSIAGGNTAVKAAVDIALHDINGKIRQQPCYQLYGADPQLMPLTAYTIGIAPPEVIRQKVAEAEGFRVLKVKLGTENDRELIRTIRSVSDLPLYADANQGWTDRKKAVELIYWLHDQGVVFIEQPMDKADREGNAWLTGRSPVPILADEAVQRLSDLDQVRGAYHGINVKLMKSGGMYEAARMISRAREYGMKVLIGCMSETSAGTLAGAALAPLCNWADLDGPFLTANNPFETPPLENGRYQLTDLPGLGLKGLQANLFSPQQQP